MTSCQVCTKSLMRILANPEGRLHKICAPVVHSKTFKCQTCKYPPWNKTSCRSRNREEINQEDFHLTKALYGKKGKFYCPSENPNYKLKVLVLEMLRHAEC